jgi:arylformamidase
MSQANMTAQEREYSPSSCVGDLDAVLTDFNDQCLTMSEKYAPNVDENVPYGPEPRTVMDIYVPKGKGPFAVHVFVHGGYWQEFSKTESTFAVGNFLDHDTILVVMDYTLAPEAKMAQIIDEARACALWVLHNIARYGGDPQNITMSGHSAGAHLLAQILAMDWQAEGFDACPLKGAALVSGVYDLRPLVGTYINAALGMDEAEAARHSPALHLPKSTCPIVLCVGGDETQSFQDQTAGFTKSLQSTGHDCKQISMPGFNHFDIILELGKPKSPLFQAIAAQMR